VGVGRRGRHRHRRDRDGRHLDRHAAVITFTGSYGLTLDAGQYPLYLDWDGEAVRIDAPPGGSTSPQTVTIAARAQQNTAAQVHVSGEAVDLYHAAVFGF
jgi:hypothetical protein